MNMLNFKKKKIKLLTKGQQNVNFCYICEEKFEN